MVTVPRPESDRVHTWFELSYSNYAVLHRTLMQSMPDEWQDRMVGCLDELRAAYRHVEQAPGYEVTAVDWKYANELSDEELTAAGVVTHDRRDAGTDDEWETIYYDRDGNEIERHERVAVPAHEPVPHYNRGRTYVEPRLFDA